MRPGPAGAAFHRSPRTRRPRATLTLRRARSESVSCRRAPPRRRPEGTLTARKALGETRSRVARGAVRSFGVAVTEGAAARGTAPKLAPAAAPASRTRTEQVSTPAHGEVQPPKKAPPAGAARSVTVVPAGKLASHVAEHDRPGGSLVTVPLPEIVRRTVRA